MFGINSDTYLAMLLLTGNDVDMSIRTKGCAHQKRCCLEWGTGSKVDDCKAKERSAAAKRGIGHGNWRTTYRLTEWRGFGQVCDLQAIFYMIPVQLVYYYLCRWLKYFYILLKAIMFVDSMVYFGLLQSPNGHIFIFLKEIMCIFNLISCLILETWQVNSIIVWSMPIVNT